MTPSKGNRTERFWGWGTKDHHFDRHKAVNFLNFLKEFYHLKKLEETPFKLEPEHYSIPESRLDSDFISKWMQKGLTIDPYQRLVHAVGKSYRDLVRIRAGKIKRYPDGVLYISNDDDFEPLFKDAARYQITIIPFGGGTGVVGGTECIGKKDSPILLVDLKKLDRPMQLDKIAMTARFQAGILGPKLEEFLNNKGYTLGHFPQSFEFSTLGGWVATRSAGQNSTKYGKIEDRVQSLTLCSPAGRIQTNAVPSSATGPSLRQMLIGSEGVYGIISDVTVKISLLPQKQKYIPGFFRSYKDGIHCFREIMQAGLKPSIMRLSDASETEMFTSISITAPLKKRLAGMWMKYKKLGKTPSFFIVAAEGLPAEVVYTSKLIKKLIAKHNGVELSESFADKWKKERFELPYLRDDLMDHGFFIDTLETAASWSQLQKIYLEMARAFQVQGDVSEKLVFGCHLSHCYVDGASLYFTFLGLQAKGQELAQWQNIKRIATEVIMNNGGCLSHHHGIGYDHRPWMPQEKTPLGIEVLKQVKMRLDPDGLLNPGKVF